MGTLIGQQIKVSWKAVRRDGTEHDYHVAGICTNQTDDDLFLQGNKGEIFNIHIKSIFRLKLRCPEELPTAKIKREVMEYGKRRTTD